MCNCRQSNKHLIFTNSLDGQVEVAAGFTLRSGNNRLKVFRTYLPSYVESYKHTLEVLQGHVRKEVTATTQYIPTYLCR